MHEDEVGVFIILGILLCILGFCIGGMIWANDYEKGQIDALTGKIEYRLQTNADKTVKWIKINKN